MDEKINKSGKIIVIAGPKGGVGKTTFTLNAAIALAKANKRVLIVDADFSVTSSTLLYGRDYNIGFTELAQGPEFFEKLKRNVTSNVDIICSPSFTTGEGEMVLGYSYRLISAIHMCHDYDFILIDTAPGFTNAHRFLIDEADNTILISTPEPPAISAAYSLVKLVAGDNNRRNLNFVVNQTESIVEGNEVYARFSTAVSYFLERTVGHLGSIPESNDVVRASKEETPLVIRFPESPASQAIENVVQRISA